MEHILISGKGFHIEGFPDAVKVIRLDGNKARELADLALHRADLEFASRCVAVIKETPNDSWLLRQASWRSAVVHFFKCFGGSAARSNRLRADQVYEGDSDGLAVFEHIKNLRNKHLVHDENSLTQCSPGAILNKKGNDIKIAKIICHSVTVDTLNEDNWKNLDLLIRRALEWVVRRFDTLCEELTRDLERESHESLFSREQIVWTKPTIEEVGKTRK